MEEHNMVEVERDYASKGVAGAGLGLGIAGTALGVLGNGGLGNILGGWGGNNCGGAMFAWERELSHKDAEIGSLRADLATDRKILELYQYADGRMRNIEAQLAQQAVTNAQITANISCMQRDIGVLNGLTKTVIPINNICPRPMPRYNNWVAPEEATTTPAG
jgi:hypothetical protein